jgi:hypothetical protein
MPQSSTIPENRRPWRDILIADLVDREEALRSQWRLERAMLLDILDTQRNENARLKAQVASQRADLMRYTATAVAGVAA